MQNLEPNELRAENAIVLIWVNLVLTILFLLFDCYRYVLLQTVAKSESISTEIISICDTIETTLLIIGLIVLIISIITFIKWFRRAYSNLHKKSTNLLYTERWAIGSWFIPLICLYRPYRIMNELYCKTKELLVNNGISGGEHLSINLVRFWWIFLL